MNKLLASYPADVTEAIVVLNANAMTTSWLSPLLRFPVCIPSRRIPHYGPGGKGGAPNSRTVVVYIGPLIHRFARVFSSLGTVMVAYG